MNILDFKESEAAYFDYDTTQTVWGEDVEISVTFETEDSNNHLTEEQISLRGVIRPLSKSLNYFEEHKADMEKEIITNIEDVGEDDAEFFELKWMLFLFYVDTGAYELTAYIKIYPEFDDEVAVILKSDNSIEVEEVG